MSSSGKEGVQRYDRCERSPRSWVNQAIKPLEAARDPLVSYSLLFHVTYSWRDHRLWETHPVLVGFLGGLHCPHGRHEFHLAEHSCLHRRWLGAGVLLRRFARHQWSEGWLQQPRCKTLSPRIRRKHNSTYSINIRGKIRILFWRFTFGRLTSKYSSLPY